MQFPEGYYKVIVNNAGKIILDRVENFENEYGHYPDIKAVWPRKAKNILDINQNNQHYFYGVSREQTLIGKLIKAMDENETINTEFAKDVINVMETFKVKQSSTGSALLFQNGTKRAIVMPIKIN